MIQIIGPQFSQWDVGRSVKVTDSEATHIHFANQGDSKAVIIEITEGSAKIPDFLLQTGKTLVAYAVLDGVTLESKSFPVRKRERPENYVYEDDKRNYIYELITDAQEATNAANEAAGVATQAAQDAGNSSGIALDSADRANKAAEDAEKASASANKAATLVTQTAISLMVVGKAMGASIYLDDAIAQPLVSCKIFGKTTQDGTPTPDAPVDLVSVGDSGSIGVSVEGKNLLDLSNFTDRKVAGVTIANNRNGSITLVSDGTYDGYYNGSVLVSVPSGRYKFVEPSSSRAAFVRLFPKGETTYKQYNSGVEFEFDNSTHEMRFLVQYDPGMVANITLWPMICLASETDATYEPHKGQKLTISTPNGLPGIPVTSGGNYTDANGRRWICDEIDFDKGVYVQRIGVKQYNNANSWGAAFNIGDRVLNDRFRVALDEVPLPFAGMSNMHSIVENWGVSEGSIGFNGSDIYVYARFPGIATREQLGELFSVTPLVIAYGKTTPIETPLSEEELAAYAALHTYKDHTTVFNDAGAYMELEYVMDAKKYIDNLVISGGGSVAKLTSVTLLASSWTGSNSLYSQVVSIPGITEYSKVDLLPSVEQLAVFHNKDVAFVTENEDGVVTVYAIGDKPLLDYTMQAQITEVLV